LKIIDGVFRLSYDLDLVLMKQEKSVTMFILKYIELSNFYISIKEQEQL